MRHPERPRLLNIAALPIAHALANAYRESLHTFPDPSIFTIMKRDAARDTPPVSERCCTDYDSFAPQMVKPIIGVNALMFEHVSIGV